MYRVNSAVKKLCDIRPTRRFSERRDMDKCKVKAMKGVTEQINIVLASQSIQVKFASNQSFIVGN